MRPFQCGQCQATLFFENTVCERCGATLGFAPASQQMRAFLPPTGMAPGPVTDRVNQVASDPVTDPAALWTPAANDTGPALRPCANRLRYNLCNWMVDVGDNHALCRSCRLTRVIPALGPPADPGRNWARWHAIEQAKRRLMFTLLGIGLGPWPKADGTDAQGLDFLLLEDQPGQPVRTGHERGTITLNIAEADDDRRETLRVQMGEPTRTLLGHLRHEAAHYLQYRWIAGTPAEADGRTAFGDERADYATALAHYYANGARSHWPQQFISAYASAHPWEDWAETCAHYLLVLDAVQTAGAWGLSLDGPAHAAPAPLDPSQPPQVHDLVLQQWLPVAQFLNAMHRSLGQRDSYPYLLPAAVLDKMGTVQRLLRQAAGP